MRKKISLLLMLSMLLLLSETPLNAASPQYTGSDFSHTKLLGAGMFVSYNYGFLGARRLAIPPVTGYYEFGVHEYVTAGPFLSLARWNYTYAAWGYSWSFMQLGGRGSFHLTPFLNDTFDGNLDEEKWDLYVSMHAGFEFRRYDADSSGDPTSYASRTRILLGPAAGARYYFAEDLALFVEGGRGSLGAMLLGISKRL